MLGRNGTLPPPAASVPMQGSQKYSRLRQHRFIKTEVRVCPGGISDQPGQRGTDAHPSTGQVQRHLEVAHLKL